MLQKIQNLINTNNNTTIQSTNNLSNHLNKQISELSDYTSTNLNNQITNDITNQSNEQRNFMNQINQLKKEKQLLQCELLSILPMKLELHDLKRKYKLMNESQIVSNKQYEELFDKYNRINDRYNHFVIENQELKIQIEKLETNLLELTNKNNSNENDISLYIDQIKQLDKEIESLRVEYMIMKSKLKLRDEAIASMTSIKPNEQLMTTIISPHTNTTNYSTLAYNVITTSKNTYNEIDDLLIQGDPIDIDGYNPSCNCHHPLINENKHIDSNSNSCNAIDNCFSVSCI